MNWQSNGRGEENSNKMMATIVSFGVSVPDAPEC